MKQRILILVMFVLLMASSVVSFYSYSETAEWVEKDMNRALALTLAEQKSDVISQDTIVKFNRNLQVAELRGRTTIAVDTRQRQGLTCEARCSAATIFSLSDQRPASILWTITLLWMMFCFYQRRTTIYNKVEATALLEPAAVAQTGHQDNLQLVDGRFLSANGEAIRLTPMQQQLMELFWQAPNHTLTKSEICAALWPKKPDASETLYTLIRRLRPIIEANTPMKIETDRGRSYALKEK